MQFFSLQTDILRTGDDLVAALLKNQSIDDGDIVVLSSKVIATVENAFIDLSTLQPSDEAIQWSMKTSLPPAFCEAILEESKRLNGHIVGHCPLALLTELRPSGLPTGTILTANAGLDQSNAPMGSVIGWPRDPVKSGTDIKEEFAKKTGKNVAVLITDSSCTPRRLGVTAIALTAHGIDPFKEQKGNKDLFGRELLITTEAIADQLATAGNFLMGNAGQAIPAVIIRDHGLALSDFSGWVPGIEPEEDLFKGIL